MRLDFNVLAQGVEAQVFHGLHVPGVALGAAGEEQAVGPVALVQEAVEEVGLAVQAEPGDAVDDLRADGPQGEIGFHSVVAISDNNRVKVGIFGGPELRVLGANAEAVGLGPVALAVALDGEGAVAVDGDDDAVH